MGISSPVAVTFSTPPRSIGTVTSKVSVVIRSRPSALNCDAI